MDFVCGGLDSITNCQTKFVTKVEIKRNFCIARSRIRGDYLVVVRVNGGSTEKNDQRDNQMQKAKWSQTISSLCVTRTTKQSLLFQHRAPPDFGTHTQERECQKARARWGPLGAIFGYPLQNGPPSLC